MPSKAPSSPKRDSCGAVPAVADLQGRQWGPGRVEWVSEPEIEEKPDTGQTGEEGPDTAGGEMRVDLIQVWTE